MLSVSKRLDLHHHLPNSSPIKEEIPTKQGIVTILLRSDCEKNNKFPPSIRRTLSADMSSKKWLQQNGLSSPKELTVPISTDNNPFSSQSECEKRPGHDEVWRSIQLINKETQKTKSSADDVWGSLVLTQKTENCISSLLTPYVHPLVKRSKSALSEKSLEICTENLGSETGSDGFPSYPSSDAEEEDKELGHKNRILVQEEFTGAKESNPFDNLRVTKYRVAPSRPIPPPLPSISAASLHMESRRENGRLVLEAVSVRPKNCFHAQRQDGRLVLTLINSPKENKEEDFANVFDKMEELEEDRDGDVDDGYEEDEKNEDNNNVETKEADFFMEQNARSLPSGMINLHKTGLLMKKLMASKNKNPTSTSYKFNQAVKVMENEEMMVVPQSLPPRPPVGRLIPGPPQAVAAASFNRYEYFWRNNKDTVKTTANSSPLKVNNNNRRINGAKTDEQAAEYFVPYLRGCYETKRSVSMWEPYCIATS